MPNSPADASLGPGPMSVEEETAMLSPMAEAVRGAKVFDSFSFRGDEMVRNCNDRFVRRY